MHKSRVTFCGINALHESSSTMYILNEKTWSVISGRPAPPSEPRRPCCCHVSAPIAQINNDSFICSEANSRQSLSKWWTPFIRDLPLSASRKKIQTPCLVVLRCKTTAQMLPINICGWLNMSHFYNKRPLSGAAAEPSGTDTQLFFFLFFSVFTHASFISQFKRRAAVFACFIPFGWEHVQRAVMWVAVMWSRCREYDLLTASWWAATFFSKNISNGQSSLKRPELHSSTWMHHGHIAEDFAV